MKAYTLITGASSGIGLELTKVFAAKGHNLLLVARRKEILETLAAEIKKSSNVGVEIFPCDLTLDDNIDKLLSFIGKKEIQVEIVINNAGLGDFKLFQESEIQKINSVISVNITAVVNLTHKLLPGMIKSGQGRILNVSSMAAFAPNPFIAVYAAAKAFILNFSHALAAELNRQNIQVSVLCPGDIKTGFQLAAGLEGFEVKSSITVQELAQFTYQKFIVERETEIIPDETRRTIESLQKITNRKLLSENFLKIRQALVFRLKNKNI
jgi:short-subunit dehydrogenase